MLERYIVAGVVQNDGKFILGKKAKGQKPYPNVWNTPGGGAEDFEKAKELFLTKKFDDEYFHEELRREIREELNLEVKNIRNIVPQFRSEPREGEAENKDGDMTHFYFLEYLCDYASGELKPGDDIAEAKWVTKKDLETISLTPPSQELYRELGWLK